MRKILVACYGNTCRSPMLEGLLKRDLAVLGKSHIVVESAGTLENAHIDTANPHSITCMRERGIDIADHRRRFAGRLDLGSYERIYVMAATVWHDMIALGAPSDRMVILRESEGGIPNPYNDQLGPYEQDMDKYIPCAAILEEESARIAASL